MSNPADLISLDPPPPSVVDRYLASLGFQEPASARRVVQHLHTDPTQHRHLAEIFPSLMRRCAASADPDRALMNFERLASSLPNRNMFYQYLSMAPERLNLLVRVFAHSQAMADTLARNAKNLHFLIAPQTLAAPRSKKWLNADLRRLLMATRLPDEAYHIVRRFRRREMLRIGTRDLSGLATVEETTLELSNLADVCLQAVYEIALRKIASGLKLPVDRVTSAHSFVVMGMGKLGGRELNYSSDVDVIFVYGEETQITSQISAHNFFTSLAEEIIQAVGSATDEGTIFRIDLRLRPEGRSGPLVSSLDACENYYAGYGETWERMALVKARPVAGDMALGQAFIDMVQPFVYRRYTGQRIIQQMAVLKQRIENEIVRDDSLQRHVKLGIGGIREIEFIVQSFQVLRGARLPVLRERNTLQALKALDQTQTLSHEEVTVLADAYRFLRNVEHRLQMEMELQTHTIPDETRALTRLARSLGFNSVEAFSRAQNAQTAAVRRIYHSVLAGAELHLTESTGPLLTTDKIAESLRAHGFSDVSSAVKTVETLLHGPGFGHISQRTKELFGQLFPILMECAGKLADPDTALMRFDRFVAGYGSRGLLYETLASNPNLIGMLLHLADASACLMDILIREPDIFDSIGSGAILLEPKRFDQLRDELTARISASVSLSAADATRLWKRTELVRIGLADVLGLVDLEQLHIEMTHLAATCLELGVSQAQKETGIESFAVIGMGKFGGQELGYGADLDVLFVGGNGPHDQARAIAMATKVTEFMQTPTATGLLFKVDPRLRPDGEKGVLASCLDAHRDYYRSRAQFWERLALTKARHVAGNTDLGRQFVNMVHEVIYARGLTDTEVGELRAMRKRIETNRGDQRHVHLEFKTGPGGLMDVEFLLQGLQLMHGHRHQSLRTSHTLAALNRLTALGIVDDESSYHVRRNYLFIRRIESVLRRMDNTGVSRLPHDAREQALLAKRLGFETVADFLKTYDLATKDNRALFDKFLPVG